MLSREAPHRPGDHARAPGSREGAAESRAAGLARCSWSSRSPRRPPRPRPQPHPPGRGDRVDGCHRPSSPAQQAPRDGQDGWCRACVAPRHVPADGGAPPCRVLTGKPAAASSPQPGGHSSVGSSRVRRGRGGCDARLPAWPVMQRRKRCAVPEPASTSRQYRSTLWSIFRAAGAVPEARRGGGGRPG